MHKCIPYNCEYYSVEKISVETKAELAQEYNFMNVSVIEGCGTVDGIEIEKGTHFILPKDYGTAILLGKMDLIVSYL